MGQDSSIAAQLSPPISEITFTAFDLETTGLNPHIDAIIEIGAVRFKNQKTIDTFHKLIKLRAGVSNTAVNINNITPEMLKGQPSMESVLPDFISFISDDVLIGHNIQNFDLPFVRTHLARLSLPPLYNQIADTFVLAKRIFPHESHYSLIELARSFTIKQNDTHRALDDAITCSKIFWRIVEEVSFMGDAPPLSEFTA